MLLKKVVSVVDQGLKLVGVKKYTKEEKEAWARTEAINRQRFIESLEIVQTWNVCFGEDIPLQMKEIDEIKDITPRDLWMEKDLIWNKVTSFRPDKTFHPMKYYVLKFQPPMSTHTLSIPLDDPAAQEHAMLILSKYPKMIQKKILFHFTTFSPFIELFAPPVHPASLVSYRTKNEVFSKLCDLYLLGKYSMEEFEHTLSCDYDVWKSAMFNMLPEDEQVYHRYLVAKPAIIITEKDVEKSYIDDRISLQDYKDYKFPDRKRIRELHAMHFPQPYDEKLCVVCQNVNGPGIIKCFNCPNYICKKCVEIRFLNEDTREGCFLVMHRRFCVKSGKILAIVPSVVPEPGYLKELRHYGRVAALDRIEKANKGVEVEEEDEEDEIDLEAIEAEKERLRLLQEEEERKLRENPPELQHILHKLEHKSKKFHHVRKEVVKYQQKLDEKGQHAESYYERIQRLKDEDMVKLVELKKSFKEMIEKIQALKLEGEPSKVAIRDIKSMFVEIKFMQEMTCLDDLDMKMSEYHENERKKQEEIIKAQEEALQQQREEAQRKAQEAQKLIEEKLRNST